MSNSLSTHTTSPTATPWSTRAGERFLATGKWFMENPMPAPEAASDERINKLIDAKQKDVIALLNDVKESLRTMQADVTTMKTDITTMKTDITTLKADMTEVKASIGTLNNRQDVQ
jgi:peptidoglycan hydrolase CwlO-like protein